MDRAKDGLAKDRSLKKRHLGVVGLLTVVLQYGVGVKNEETTKLALQQIAAQEMAKVQSEVTSLRLERDRDFIRKSEVKEALSGLDSKLDRVRSDLESVASKVSNIEGYLRGKQGDQFGDDLTSNEEDPEVAKR